MYICTVKHLNIKTMATTVYEIVSVNKGRKTLEGKEVKSIKGMMALLKAGEEVVAAQLLVNNKEPKSSMFHRWKVGYRTFNMNKTGISYSRYPQYEY